MSESQVPPFDGSSAPGAQTGPSSPPPPQAQYPSTPPPQYPAPPQYQPPPPSWSQQQPPRRSFWRRVLGKIGVIILVLSVLMNIYLMFIVSHLAAGPFETSILTEGKENQVIAVYKVSGVINDKQADIFDLFCRQVTGNDNIKAVVLRVNSPGGHISACDRIYKQMESLKTGGRKLVVSMGSLAASGGYYISVPAETIYAEPTTITGSIGVIGGWFILKGTLEKIGAECIIMRSTKTRAWKAAPTSFEDPADYQMKELQRLLDKMQERFEEIVKQGRGAKLKLKTARKTYKGADGKEFEVVETEPFNGKIFLSSEAEKMGLIDKVGFIKEAINEATSLAGLTKPKVVEYARRKSFVEQMGFGASSSVVNLETLDEIQTPRIMMIWKVSQ